MKSDAKHYGITSSSVLHILQACLSDFSPLPRCCPTPQQWPQGRLAIMAATCFTQFTYCKNTCAQKRHTEHENSLTLASTIFLSPCRAVLQMWQMWKCYLSSSLGQKPCCCIRTFKNKNTLGWKFAIMSNVGNYVSMPYYPAKDNSLAWHEFHILACANMACAAG